MLNGRVAIVTGGGVGIGRGIAQALGAEGVRVAICGRRSQVLDETTEELQRAGGGGHGHDW